VWKELGEKAIELRKIGYIGYQDGRIYHQVEPTVSSP